MILIVVIFILIMQFLWVYIDELVGKGLSLGVVAEFLFWGSCTVLPLALPLATLLASMMTIGQMGENNELIALKSAGVSVLRVMLPIMIASFVVSIGTFFVINKLVPVSYNEIYTLRDDIGKTKDEIKIPSGTFYDGVEGYMLRVDRHNDKTGMMEGVMLYDHNGGKGNTRLTLADSAVMKMSKDKTYLTFRMYNGTNYQENNQKSYRDTTLDLQKIDFSRQEMIITLENYAFRKSDSARFGDQVKTLPLRALKHQQDSLEFERDSVKSEQLISTAAFHTFALKDQLDTVRSGIRYNFSDSAFLKFNSKEAEERAYRLASESASQIQANLQNYEFGAFDYTVRLRWTAIELLRRFAQALACFIMFFLGAPLGALIRKGGLGVSAIISVMFFALYWVVDITGVKLGRDGSVAAWVSAFSSSIVLMPIGIYLTFRAIHDTDLSNLDAAKNWWRKARSKVGGFFRKTRIVYMGTPEFAVAPLEALIEKKYKIAAVVTVADKPSGRGQTVHESAVKQYAAGHGLPVLQPVKLKDPAFLKQLKDLKADLFIVVAFRMLPEEVWSMPKLGTFNLHAALLPQYRGAAPINWAVINGETRTGATTFMIDKDIDTGGIILRQGITVSDTDTAGDVHDKLMAIGAEMVVQTAEGLIEHNVDTRVQRSFIQGSEVLKPAPKLTRELCHIDWNDTTKQVYNLIRGLSPFPAAFTELTGGNGERHQLKIFRAEKVEMTGTTSTDSPQQQLGLVDVHPRYAAAEYRQNQLPTSTDKKPGTIVSDGKTFMDILTADGAISLKEVQIAGKKRLDIQAFLAGFRNPEAYVASAGTSKAEIARTKKP